MSHVSRLPVLHTTPGGMAHTGKLPGNVWERNNSVLTYLLNHFPLVQGDVTAEMPDRGTNQEPVYVHDQGL